MDIKLSELSITTFGISWDSWDFLGFRPEFVIPAQSRTFEKSIPIQIPIPKFWKIDPKPNPKILKNRSQSQSQNLTTPVYYYSVRLQRHQVTQNDVTNRRGRILLIFY